jgi:hypothetical protein
MKNSSGRSVLPKTTLSSASFFSCAASTSVVTKVLLVRTQAAFDEVLRSAYSRLP